MGGNLSDFCHAAALQSDGKMVLTGTTKIGSKNVFALVRYEKNARINYNSLYFKTYIDKNLNGIKDSSEPLYPNATAMVTRVGVDTIFATSSSGEYLVDVDTGKYIVKVTPVLPYYNLVPTQYTKTFTSYFNEDTFFIGLQPIPGFKDVAVSLIPRLPLKPGNPLWHSMQCLNQGTDTISGTFTYIKDSRDTLGFSQITPTSIIGDTLHFAYTNLPPGGEITNDIYFIVPPPPLVNIGDTIHSFMYASPIAGETNIADNYSQLSEIVKGPWDPNDKQEAHGGKIALAKAKAGEYLTYTIRFQNTGTDTAFNGYVRDTMDRKRNWNSIQVIAASHNYQMTMNDGKCLFTFPMIKLVDSIKNEPLSHGYIVYKIKIKPNVQIGDVIKNTAAIYFDYNLPIFTNTEMTKVVADALPLKLLSFSAKKQDKTNLLQWQTANEINVDRFEVERSFDSRKFNKIGKVKAGLSNYSFIDNNALKATNYYRLRMVDKDGQFTYSPIRQITIDNSAFTITIFPNPAKDNLQVQIDSDKKMALKLQVISLDGKVLLNTSFNATEGSILRSINISALLRGSYLLKIKSIDVQEERVVKFEKL